MIKVLDKATIDKIAAGEVIERPSSVVKELLENSVDAGATSVTVEIKDGGIAMIRVTDNGIGIEKDEVRVAVMRHATSKIETADDLNGVMSLGFRGEALATIAAVSQTELVTKTRDALVGVKYVIHGGEEIEYSEVGVPDGTTIVVKNLFYNTPARKKFLKTPMTEASYISDLVTKLALSNSNIAFRLIVNGATKIDTAGNGNLKDTIYALYGKEIAHNLLSVDYREGDVKIKGFCGRPNINRGNRAFETYFINGRYIKSPVIGRAIEEGYRTFVMQHQFPFTVLMIELPPEKCDVNVHPTKQEFKYDDEKGLFSAVCHACRTSLQNKDLIPESNANTKSENQRLAAEEKREAEQAAKAAGTPAEPFESKRVAPPAASFGKSGRVSGSYKILEKLKSMEQENDDSDGGSIPIENLLRDSGATYIVGSDASTDTEAQETKPTNVEEKLPDAASEVPEKKFTGYDKKGKRVEQTYEQESLFDENFLTEKARKKHRLIGQVFGTYWLIEYEDKLFIMDQHAAHEKINYEALYKNFKEKTVLSQQLLPPIVVTLSYAERQAVMDNYDLFMKFGYDLEEFGGYEFKINAVPSNLFGIPEKELFMDFVASLTDNAGYMSNDVFVRKLSTMACKAAIKGNMRISFEEADHLIDELLTLENPYTCPHGRPTLISISEQELEKKFKRIV